MGDMKKPKLLIVTERFHPEEFVINELSLKLSDRFSITVLTQNPSYPFDKPFAGWGNPFVSIRRWKGIRIIRGYSVLGYKRNVILKMLNYAWFAFFTSLLALIAVGRVDRVLVFHTGPLTLAIPAGILARLNRRQISIWTQDVWPDTVFAYGFKKKPLLVWFLNALVRWVYAPCKTVFISCEGFRSKIARYTRHCKVIHAPNWSSFTDNGTSSQVVPKPAGSFAFMFAGNVGTVQNLEQVISAFAQVAKKHAQASLEIVGDGSALQGLKELASSLDCPRVTFHGRVPSSRMSAYYAMADALIVSLVDRPIFHLTVPQKFQTYLSVGKPILAAINGEVASLVNENSLGAQADANDVSGIANAMEKILSLNGKEISGIRARATSLLERNYNKETIIGSIARDLLGQNER